MPFDVPALPRQPVAEQSQRPEQDYGNCKGYEPNGHCSGLAQPLRDTRTMSEESTTPDSVERVRRQFEAGNRRDIDAVMSSFAVDAVF
jgi:hypothetical protein